MGACDRKKSQPLVFSVFSNVREPHSCESATGAILRAGEMLGHREAHFFNPFRRKRIIFQGGASALCQSVAVALPLCGFELLDWLLLFDIQDLRGLAGERQE